jgi:hypothetical protein
MIAPVYVVAVFLVVLSAYFMMKDGTAVGPFRAQQARKTKEEPERTKHRLLTAIAAPPTLITAAPPKQECAVGCSAVGAADITFSNEIDGLADPQDTAQIRNHYNQGQRRELVDRISLTNLAEVEGGRSPVGRKKMVAFAEKHLIYPAAEVDRSSIVVSRISKSDEDVFERFMCGLEGSGTAHVQKRIKPHRLKTEDQQEDVAMPVSALTQKAAFFSSNLGHVLCARGAREMGAVVKVSELHRCG